ncbi:MAG: hypothetical protein KAT66_10070 [Candidatus Lokiarchaeota archaeon]|nr:hypothetical protein [Candidatus Lokiarchaeota archaeon]
MPRGMFFLIHDEIKGPEIKCSYYSSPITIPQEFISKLYMTHAGFESSSHIDIKFGHYRSITCFTGNLDRRSQKEGILGIIFEENERFGNIDLFLQRNLNDVINKPDNQILEEIFSNKLLNYLELNKIFEKVEIEDISDILIINGDKEFRSCILRIGEKKVSNPEMIEVYQKIMEKQKIPQYQYIELNSEGINNTFLVLKVDKPNQNIDKIVSTIKSYLDNFYYYSLEILTLFLLPSIVSIIPLKPKLSKKYSDKSKSVLENLKNSDNYYNEFNNLISHLVKGDLYLSPIL